MIRSSPLTCIFANGRVRIGTQLRRVVRCQYAAGETTKPALSPQDGGLSADPVSARAANRRAITWAERRGGKEAIHPHPDAERRACCQSAEGEPEQGSGLARTLRICPPPGSRYSSAATILGRRQGAQHFFARRHRASGLVSDLKPCRV